MIVFECPTCQKKLQANDEHVGKSIQCPACKAIAKVPPPDTPPDAITTEPVATSPAAPTETAVTTPEQVRKSNRDRDDEDEERRPGRRDRGSAPKAGMGMGMVLLLVGVLGGGCLCVGGILVALIVPAIAKVQEAANRTKTLNHLKEIGLAEHNHLDTMRFFPSPRHQPQPPQMNAADLSWRVSILPFLEQDNLFRQFDKNADWNNPNNQRFLPMMPPQYYCLTTEQKLERNEQNTFFQYFTGPNTVFPDPLQKAGIAQFPDGTSNTILVAQAQNAVPWSKAEDMALMPNGPLPLPSGQFLVLLADGSVRTMNRTRVPDPTLRLLIDPRDGQVLPGNAFD
jgi:hypothetical protein